MRYSKVHIMQKERDPLNLGSLPAVAPPVDGWPAIRAELEKQQQRRRMFRDGVITLAAAASLVLAVGLYVRQPGPELSPVQAPQAKASPAEAPQDGVPQALDSLVSLSGQLERRVRNYRSEFGGMPTESLVYQVELEDLIAQVDEELSMNPESTELWSKRVNLLLDLSQLYQNQLRRDYHRMASL